MGLQQIHEDLHVLAGRLLHRATLTDGERRAAEYLHDRFSAATPDVETDRFATIENYPLLFAMYYGEFLFVALIAGFFPRIAVAYGCVVFVLYLAELMGYRTFSRLLPQYESQNVCARFLAPQPKALFVFTAHYDSGRASPLTHPGITPWVQRIHTGIVLAMVTVLAGCALTALGIDAQADVPYPTVLRWAAAAALLSAAIVLLYAGSSGEDVRGANSNASGVAALLQLAERFQQRPLETADVWLVATGAHECWMSGMRHLLTTHQFDRRTTYIINIESVGAGKLNYLTHEGFLNINTAARPLVQEAKAAAPDYGARPGRMFALPTAAHMAHVRGLPTLTLMGLDLRGLPYPWNWVDDRLTEVDDNAVAVSAEFAEVIARNLARREYPG